MQFDDTTTKAQDILFSHTKCMEFMSKKSEKLGTNEYTVLLDRVRLWPGWREVFLRVIFPDKEGFEARVDVDRKRVYWIRTLGPFNI